MSWQQVH